MTQKKRGYLFRRKWLSEEFSCLLFRAFSVTKRLESELSAHSLAGRTNRGKPRNLAK